MNIEQKSWLFSAFPSVDVASEKLTTISKSENTTVWIGNSLLSYHFFQVVWVWKYSNTKSDLFPMTICSSFRFWERKF